MEVELGKYIEWNRSIASRIKVYARYALPAIRMRLYRELRRGALWERALTRRYRVLSDEELASRLEKLMRRFTPRVRRYAREFTSLYKALRRSEEWIAEIEKPAETRERLDALKRFALHEVRVVAGTYGAVVRYYSTMKGWIRTLREMIGELARKNRELRRIDVWIGFRIVIGFKYLSGKKPRNIEAHLKSECIDRVEARSEAKVKGYMALTMLIKSPEWAPPYTMPLLAYDEEWRRELREKTGDVKRRREAEWMAEAEWSWGIEWFDAKLKLVDKVYMEAEIFDYDYNKRRRYASADLPREWWRLSVDEIVETLRRGASIS